MKRKIIEVGRDLLVIQMNHWVFLSLVLTIAGLIYMEEAHFAVWVLMSLLPVYLYSVKAKIGNFFLSFLLHLLPVAAVVLIPVADWKYKLLLVAMAVIHCIWSIRERTDKNVEKTEVIKPMIAVLVIGIGSFMQSNYGTAEWNIYYMIAVFVYVFCYFVCYFMSQYLDFLGMNERSAANIPEREIFRSGIKQVLGYAVLGMVALILTANIGWFGYLMKLLGNGILRLISFLFGMEEGDEIVSIEDPLDTYYQDTAQVEQEYNSSPIWDYLFVIVLIIGMILLMILIIKELRKGIRLLWDGFHNKRKRAGKVVDENEDIREVCGIEKEEKSGFRLFAFLNHQEKIRRLYKKQVVKNKERILGERDEVCLKYYTAKECCDKFSANNLKTVYEKVRYSEEAVTAEEVKLAKAGLK